MLERLTALLALGLALALVPGCRSEARGRARKAQCSTHLVKIKLALVDYGLKHNGEFPRSLDALVEAGALDAETLRCPAVVDKGGACDYFFYQPRRLVEVDPKALLACDLQTNHPDGRSCLYANGAVRFLSEERFQQELTKPENAAFAAALRDAEAK